MYETDGGVRPIAWVFAAVFGVIGLWIGEELLLPDVHAKGGLVQLLNLLAQGAFFYGAYRLVRKIFRKPDTKD
jgi:hypothetical protein